MKLLIIAVGIGDTPGGIIYKRVILALSKYNEITVVSNTDFEIGCHVKKIIIPILELPVGITKILKSARLLVTPSSLSDLRPSPLVKDTLRLVNYDYFDNRWSNRVNIATNKEDYEFVLALTGFIEFAPILAAQKCANSKKSKWGMYSVDPIPIPREWGTNLIQYYNCKKMLRGILSNADLVCFSNPRMLEYNTSLYRPQKDSVLDYLYTPSPSKMIEVSHTTRRRTLLYTGSLYGRRNAEYCILAFKRILKEYPDVKLVFVGTKLPAKYKRLLTKSELSSIETYSFQKDLTQFYNDCYALIDIDADCNNDVFLSSKIVSYIKISRPIISETGFCSPSRLLFSGIESVIQCNHDANDVFTAMKIVLDGKNFDYDDRKGVIEILSPDYFSDKFQCLINKTLRKN